MTRPSNGMVISSRIEQVIKSTLSTNLIIQKFCRSLISFCFLCNFALVAEEVHSLETPSILDEQWHRQWHHQSVGLLVLVDVIAAAQSCCISTSAAYSLSTLFMPMSLLSIPHVVLTCPRASASTHCGITDEP